MTDTEQSVSAKLIKMHTNLCYIVNFLILQTEIYVHYNNTLFRSIESCPKNRSFSKLTKIVDVVRRHGAKKSTNIMELTREKADKNFGNADECKINVKF